MTRYAVHHAWVDDHAVKAPVGIWGEGGVSFCPVDTESYRKKGSQLLTMTVTLLRLGCEERVHRFARRLVAWRLRAARIRRGLPRGTSRLLFHARAGSLVRTRVSLLGLLRDQIPVAIVSIEGRVYRADRRYELTDEYVKNERRMLLLVTNILSDLLP